ncbi:hypothetical protein QFZ26_002029 [Agromyces ramosus]|uniref:DUF2510 domain-containing protein n=1 Tax=Agromyces ramosus TaxID=33879 RepID=A0ABU0RBR9_9MICO|nr:hypothetical protein [Agromyces ramosus]
MLRWWDGTDWSETDFRLARPLLTTEMQRDLLLGPVGRRGSVINVAVCSGLIIFGIVFALNVHPAGWGIAGVAGVLDVVFITVAVVVHRYRVASTLRALLWPSREH